MASPRSPTAKLQSDREDSLFTYLPPSWAHKEWEQYYNYPSLSQAPAPRHGMGESYFGAQSSPSLELKRQRHPAHENTPQVAQLESPRSRGSDTGGSQTPTPPAPAGHPAHRRARTDTITPSSLGTIDSVTSSGGQTPPMPSILSSLSNERSGYSKLTLGVSSPIGASFMFPQQVSLPGESPPRYSRQQSPGSRTTSSSPFSEEESCLSPLSPTVRYHVDSSTLFGDMDFDSPRSPPRSNVKGKLARRPPRPPPKGGRQEAMSTPRTSLFTQARFGDSKRAPSGGCYSDPGLSRTTKSRYPQSAPKQRQPRKGETMPNFNMPFRRLTLTRDQQQALAPLGEESEESSPEPSPALRPSFAWPDQSPLRSVPTQPAPLGLPVRSNLRKITYSPSSSTSSSLPPRRLPPTISPPRTHRKKIDFSPSDLLPSLSELSPEQPPPTVPTRLPPQPRYAPLPRDSDGTEALQRRRIPLMPGSRLRDSEFSRHMQSDDDTCSTDTGGYGPFALRQRPGQGQSSCCSLDANVPFSQPGIARRPSTNVPFSQPGIARRPSTNVPVSQPGIARRPSTNLPFSQPGIARRPSTNLPFSQPGIARRPSSRRTSQFSSGLQSIDEQTAMAAGPWPSPTDTVNTLTGRTFQEFIQQQKMAVVMFYSSATGDPETLDTWGSQSLKAARRVKPAFASVDCAEEADLCASEGIPTYPFYKMYSGGYLLNAVKDFGLLNY